MTKFYQDHDKTRRIVIKRLLKASSFVALGFFPNAVFAKKNHQALDDPNREDWDKSKTWVFAIGILEWQDQDLSSFPKEGRRDVVFLESLKEAGVPAQQIVFIQDREATRNQIRNQLSAMLKRTRAGDFLWFYYAGHGTKWKRDMWFTPYDTVSSTMVNGISLSKLFDWIEKEFSGNQVLLTGDCCHSGAMVEQAIKRSNRIAYGAITSSLSSELSTGSWSFTNCLIDGLRGYPSLGNGGNDNHISFEELAIFSKNYMAFAEGQLAASGFGDGFPKKYRLSQVSQPIDHEVGRFIEVKSKSKSKTHKAVVIDAKSDSLMVRYTESEMKSEWIPRSRTQEYKPVRYPVGARVYVEYDGEWYKGKIMAEQLGVHHIRYDGYSQDDDEWVAATRIKLR